ncbi:MAG: thioredoxin family protein [Turicibacter sp.]
MKILTLGCCCKRSLLFLERTERAVNQLGLDVKVENSGDIRDISRFGITRTPALVINDMVITSGALLSVEQLMELISNEIKK